MYTALRLQKRLKWSSGRITVIDPRSYMTYQPFLPEAAGSSSRDTSWCPLRRVLRSDQVITGEVIDIRHADRIARMKPRVRDAYDLAYDQSWWRSPRRMLPIPGLAELGIGFKQVEEAIALRNHVLERLDIAASTPDELRSTAR